MRERTYWIDHVLSPTRQFTVVATGTTDVYTITPYGTVMQQGTAQSADNFNSMEEGLVANEVATDILIIHARQQEWELDELADAEAELSGTVSTNTSNISSLSSSVSTNTKNIATNTSSISTLNSSLSTTNSTVNTLKSNVEDAEADFIVQTATVTLSNTLDFPFNDSQITVALSQSMPNIYYRVDVEVTAFVGNVGEIEVTGKQTNGFKIAYTGSASSVEIQYTAVSNYVTA